MHQFPGAVPRIISLLLSIIKLLCLLRIEVRCLRHTTASGKNGEACANRTQEIQPIYNWVTGGGGGWRWGWNAAARKIKVKSDKRSTWRSFSVMIITDTQPRTVWNTYKTEAYVFNWRRHHVQPDRTLLVSGLERQSILHPNMWADNLNRR